MHTQKAPFDFAAALAAHGIKMKAELAEADVKFYLTRILLEDPDGKRSGFTSGFVHYPQSERTLAEMEKECLEQFKHIFGDRKPVAFATKEISPEMFFRAVLLAGAVGEVRTGIQHS